MLHMHFFFPKRATFYLSFLINVEFFTLNFLGWVILFALLKIYSILRFLLSLL